MNKLAVLDASVFIIGWILFVLAQAQNSVKSKTNGLNGVSDWFKLHAVNLATRAFFSALAYGFIVHTVAQKIEAVGGLQLTATSIAGIGGYAANGLLYQLFGFMPWFRVEVADLAPPAAPGSPAPAPPAPAPPAK
jgi:hypothetical protein